MKISKRLAWQVIQDSDDQTKGNLETAGQCELILFWLVTALNVSCLLAYISIPGLSSELYRQFTWVVADWNFVGLLRTKWVSLLIGRQQYLFA